LNKLKKIKDEVAHDIPVIETVERDITNRGIEITQTTDEQMKKYMEIEKIPESERFTFLEVCHKYELLKKDI